MSLAVHFNARIIATVEAACVTSVTTESKPIQPSLSRRTTASPLIYRALKAHG